MQHDGAQYSPQALEAAAGNAGKAAQDAARRNFLRWIPRQVGAPTKYAQNLTHWMHFILGAQAVLGACRLFYLMDFLGSFWMIGVIALGLYAWQQDMNIEYICIWGIACLLNGLLDIVAMIIPLVFGLLSLDVFAMAVRVCTPASELVGAAFAWNLYCDFQEDKGLKPPYPNPFKRFFTSTDPEANPMQAAKMAVSEGQAAAKRLHQPELGQAPQAAPQQAAQGGGDYGAVGQGAGPHGPEVHAGDRPAGGFPRRKNLACC